MPAAAVIPAPIAYIKVVAVKKLVVGFLDGERSGPRCAVCTVVLFRSSLWGSGFALICRSRGTTSFTVKKLECSKQAFCCEYISME